MDSPQFYIGKPRTGYIEKFGIQWKEGISPLQINLACFREKMAKRIPWKHGGPSPMWHFKAVAMALWPDDAPQGEPRFIWNRWNSLMLQRACEHNYLAVAGCAGLGKCLAPEVPVLFHDGTIKRADQVRTGDLLMGDDSLPRTVIGTKRGSSNMVKIIPKRGGLPWRCNDDHILTLKRTFSGPKSSLGTGETIDISVKDFLKKSPRFQKEHKLFCVGIDFPEQPIEISPRAYGIWLGDGKIGDTLIESHDKEQEVDKYIEDYFTSTGYVAKKKNYGKQQCGTWIISKQWNRNNPFRKLVKESSISGSKRIAKRFLHNSRAVRMELLAGILDADGHTNGTSFEISSSYDGLHDDIVFLARSLGFRVSSKLKKVNCNGKICDSKRISIRGNTDEIPTLRKKCRKKTGTWNNASYTAFTIEQDGLGEWAGFQVDGNGRYLLGDFTVTHNSEFCAIWMIIQFLCDPENTLCITTSTTMGSSKMKMWAKIVTYWTPLEAMGLPGKLVDSLGRVRYVDPKGDSSKGDLAGIALVPSDKKKEKEAKGALIGIHPKRAIFVADDLTELSKSVTEAAFSNLSMGCEYFQFIGLANPLSYFDSFGEFAKPKDGWQSITVEDEEWETVRGTCIHFDATKNPRITEGDERLIWMLNQEDIERKIEYDGSNSASFWRMVRGFWAPEGIVEYIYTEIEIITSGADKPAIWRDESSKIPVCFLDPAFTHGGDRCVAQFGTYGKNNEGYDTLEYGDFFIFKEDITNKEMDRTRQAIYWWRDLCVSKGVSPRNAGLDCTAAGPFLDDVHLFWSKEILGINFGGRASEKAVSVYDPTPACERYGNRVTEIWHAPKEALRTGQIKGLGPDMIQEMCLRKRRDVITQYTRVFAQPKKEMKAECGFSPDLADAGMGLAELCRERFGFNTGSAAKAKHPGGNVSNPFKKLFQKIDLFSVKKQQFVNARNLGFQ